MTRLQKQIAAARASYLELNSVEVRRDLEEGVMAAGQLLNNKKRLAPETTEEIKIALKLIVTDGFGGGAWWKVHAALAEEWPELYQHLKAVLPDARSGDHPFSL